MNAYDLFAIFISIFMNHVPGIIGPDASKSFCTNGDCKVVWSPAGDEDEAQ